MNSESSFVIEIATTDYASVKEAVTGGADRIELCAALSEGGLTPSMGLVKQCRADFSIALFPIIRIRSGDFLYTDAEFEIMKQDALYCKQAGCDGIVVGFLNSDGCINKQRIAEIVEAVYPLEVTFHRAFDRCRDPIEALETIIEAGCQRILTSGLQPTAIQGIDVIKALVTKAAGRVIIMPGSGVCAGNIKRLAEETGATEFHASLRTTVSSEMQYRQPAFATDAESYSHTAVQATDVAELRRVLNGIL
jgi:copper homeostasis protein